MAEEQRTAGGQPMSVYWKEAWQKAQNRELEAQKVIRSQAKEILTLNAELNGANKEIKCQKKGVMKLRGKLTALEDAAQDESEDEDEEDYERDGNGRYRAENDFDSRDHL